MKICPGFEEIDLPNKIYCPKCAIVYINGIRAEFWYYETLGFLDYWKDSNTAFDNLKDAIKTYGQIWRDSQ